VWVTPIADNFRIEGTEVYFQARAYPETEGDPRIAYVEFTGGTPGGPWTRLCRAPYPPVSTNRYACVTDIAALGYSNGPITVSFDVYDTEGNHTLAPHGMRPGTVANAMGWCECVEFIKNTFGLVDPLSVRGSRSIHAKDMRPYLQEQGWVQVSEPRTGGRTIAIIDNDFDRGFKAISGHVALVSAFEDLGNSWRLTLEGANQTQANQYSLRRCSNVNRVTTTASKTSSDIAFWHNPNR
jgi:hypothetical protein